MADTAAKGDTAASNEISAKKMAAKETPAKKAISKRGALAREKLKRAALAVIESKGYSQMKVADVTKEAGVAAGLFYHYFSDLKSLTVEVLTDFLANFEIVHYEEVELDWYAILYQNARELVDNYATHPGVMRCLLFLSDEEPEFGEIYHASASRRINALAKALPKVFPQAELSENEALMLVYSLSGTMGMLLREYYITKNSALCASELSREQVAEMAAVIFYRGLFLKNPPGESRELARRLDFVASDFCAADVKL